MFNTNIVKKIKIEEIIIIIFPFIIITGPALPDILACILIIYFLINFYKEKKINFKDDYWIFFFIVIFLWFIFISFFAYNIYLSFIDATIFIRFFLFILSIYYFCYKNIKIFKYILISIFLSITFVCVDTLFQFYNYESAIGFKGDIFNIYPEGLYGRLSGPFTDLVPGTYLARFYFLFFLLFFIDKTMFQNKYLIFCFILLSGLLLSVIYFTGERMAFATTLMGYFIIFFTFKKLRNIILLSFIIGISFILINKFIHPFYNNYVIIQNTAKHEGLIIERNIKCKNDSSINCKKIFNQQPPITSILKDFNKSAYGEIYYTALKIWQNNKITGIGLNNFEEVCLKEDRYQQYHNNFGCGSHPHNYYVQALVEAGLPGLILFTALVMSFFFKLRFFINNKNHLFGIIILLVLFWPIMSTGSFLKNWNMIFACYLIGITFGISTLKFKNLKI